jgi:DNA-directed RNA polymerase subunit K/omega
LGLGWADEKNEDEKYSLFNITSKYARALQQEKKSIKRFALV